jgi:hypothetical protein
LIEVFCSVTVTLATVPFVTVIAEAPRFSAASGRDRRRARHAAGHGDTLTTRGGEARDVASVVVHVIACPLMVPPFASFTAAVSVVPAFCAIDGDDGDTVTDPTGIGTTVTWRYRSRSRSSP